MNGLVGREHQVRELAHALRNGIATVVHGEAGVGKSALVDAVVSGTVARGGAFASLSWLPYLPLRRAFPALAADVWTGDAEYVAGQIADAVEGLPLVLEDLQWSDTATLGVIELLGPSRAVIATVRRGDPRAEQVLSQLATAGFAVLDLEPLERDAASALATRLNPALAHNQLEGIVRRSGGNPLLIEELTRVDGVVDTLNLALGLRLEALSARARRGLLLLAAADRALPAGLVPGGDELVVSGLAVTPTGLVEARHQLVAEVVLDLATPAERDAAHRRLLDLQPDAADQARHLRALGDLPAARAAAVAAADQATTPGELLSHLLMAVDCSPSAISTDLVLRSAAAANDAGEHREAQRLLDLLPAHARDDPACLRLRGEALFGLGDAEGWEKTVIEGAAVATTAHDRLYFAAEEAAIDYFVHNNPERCVSRASEALATAEKDVPRGALLRRLGAAQYLLGRPEWPTTMESAVAEAQREGDVAGTFAALNNLISAHESAGDPILAVRLAEDAIDRAAELRLGRWERHMKCRRLSLAVYGGDHSFVERIALPLLCQPLMPQTRAEVGFYLASSYADLGRSSDALQVADEHVRGWGMRRSDYNAARALAFLSGGRPLAALRERDAFLSAESVTSMVTIMEPVFAWAAWAASRPLAPIETELPSWGMLAGVGPELAGIAHLQAEAFDDAVESFGQAAELFSGYHHRRTVRSRWGQGLALVRAGRKDEGRDVLHNVAKVAERHGLVPILALVDRTLGELDGRRGRTTAARATSPAGLSGQEVRVVELVGHGLSDAQIAQRLGVSVRTVQSQLASARTKLGARTRHHAVELLAESGSE